MIRLHRQLPELEFLRRNGFLEALRERDLVEKPVGASLVRDVFRAISEENASYHAVAMPLLAAAELRQLGAGEFGLVGHGIAFPLVRPPRWGLDATRGERGASATEFLDAEGDRLAWQGATRPKSGD